MSKNKKKDTNIELFSKTDCSSCRYEIMDRNDFPCINCVNNAVNYYKKRTNYEKIRMMSEEELADFLYTQIDIIDDGRTLIIEGKEKHDGIDILEWLRSEVE